jgi:hypothetical protein
MVVGSKQIKKMICLACKDIIGDHSFNKLGKCLVRVQSELLLKTDGYSKFNKNRNDEGTTVGEIETTDKENSVPNSNLNEDILGQKIVPNTSDGDLGFNKIGEINAFDK